MPTPATLDLPAPIAEALGRPRRWLVTGAAGFIGAHLVENLLLQDQEVVGLDDFSTGSRARLDDLARRIGTGRWQRFTLHEGDVRSPADCRRAVEGADVVLHLAARGPAAWSLVEPLETHAVNVLGTVRLLEASRRGSRPRFVLASCSSVYGDDLSLPWVEESRGTPLSPYAASKVAAELAAGVYARAYGLATVSLRFFDVYGPGESPDGPYAGVVPRWIRALLDGDPVVVRGDGETRRELCFVTDAVRASFLAGLGDHTELAGGAVNVSGGERPTLNRLLELLGERISRERPGAAPPSVVHEGALPGEPLASEADPARALRVLDYRPRYDLRRGLDETVAWFRIRTEGAPEAV